MRIKKIIEWFCISGSSILMFLYGIGKPFQFVEYKNFEKPIKDLSGQELMWSFYAYSNVFPMIVGFLEVLSAILIIFKKTRVLGGIIMTILLSNIILQDIFYNVNIGALITAIYIQVFVIIIFYFNKNKILRIYNVMIEKEKENINWKYIIIGFLLFVLFKFFESKIQY